MITVVKMEGLWAWLLAELPLILSWQFTPEEFFLKWNTKLNFVLFKNACVFFTRL